ncbi:MAG: orotidine-5'-phosphate decarboxylase [Candidatus Omnitrophica bacterium]|nr:orotidine-5'-phosphate decarboxylase [Candidatus Omnitrophota bacterium]
MTAKLELSSNQKTLKDRIIVALDTSSLDMVKKLVGELEGYVSLYKVGFELFTAHGWDAVDLVRKKGADIFLDLKYHDIPNTVSKAAEVICEKDVQMFNLHTLGGLEMMKKTREAVDRRSAIRKRKPIILGVTILTSHSEKDLARDFGMNKTLDQSVLDLAGLAKKAGLDGVVSSPQEVEMLRKEFGKDFIIVTPGIRPPGSPKDDQKRTFTPQEAFECGASYIVIGRPITSVSNPRQAMEKILESL